MPTISYANCLLPGYGPGGDFWGETNMKTLLLAAVLGLSAIAAPASAASQDFTILNNTGYPIAQVYVSASAKEDWEEDVLGKDILADGDRTKIRFNRDEDACLWDLKVVYSDEESAEWQGINLCKVSVVALSYDRKSGRTSAETE